MRCRPGDIAYITHPALVGKLVTVLYQAPHGEHYLPDGQLAISSAAPCWVCESMGAPFVVLIDIGRGETVTRETRFAVIQDHWLRPIRGDELPAEVSRPEMVGPEP